jgi:hypothetical protein
MALMMVEAVAATVAMATAIAAIIMEMAGAGSNQS